MLQNRELRAEQLKVQAKAKKANPFNAAKLQKKEDCAISKS
jgi:hypothetical protein